MKKWHHILAACLLAGPMLSCQPSPETPLTTLAAPSQEELAQLQNSPLPEANSTFALHFFQSLAAAEGEKNLFVSPLSLSVALSMLYQGASGETKTEMAQALSYDQLSDQEINSGNLTLRKRLLNPGKGVEILLANALWGRKDIVFAPDFLKTNLNYYDAQLQSLDFSSSEALKTINDWASTHTRGKIPKVLDQIDPLTILILMNAIYFKGSWTDPFKPENTHNQAFHKADGKTLDTPMMSRSAEHFHYFSDDTVQAVALPYGQDEQTEMLLFLPAEGQSLQDWETKLDLAQWQEIMAQMHSRPGRVVLPKFKLKTTVQLNQVMKDLGMVKAFDEAQADFGPLLESPGIKAFVSQIKQDAFVDVNEEGTEAAAVTTITVGATSAVLTSPFEMVLDRPFCYAIYDKSSQSILFMGNLYAPAQ